MNKQLPSNELKPRERKKSWRNRRPIAHGQSNLDDVQLEIFSDGGDNAEVQTTDANQTNPTSDNPKEILCRDLARNYVRKEGRFFRRNDPTTAISASDLKRAALIRFSEKYREIELTDELWREVYQYSVEEIHTDKTQTIPVWDGRSECCPEVSDGLIWSDGSASINTWTKPEYRNLGLTEADYGMFQELLERMFRHDCDRTFFLDWLSWSLQNEGSKPSFSILLYSQTKGTGKSIIGQVLNALFGPSNSIGINGISKLTSRFNQTLMSKKFITCEEVKLKPGTDAGNAVKSFITEPRVAVEGKGKEVTEVRSVSVYLMTTNHYPHWIEPDDRRFYVIDANHPGHASGPDNENFQSFMSSFYKYMDNPENIARLYNALMVRQQSNGFNPRSLNMAAVDTPIIQRLHAASGEVLQQELAEFIAGTGKFAIPQASLRKLFFENLKVNPNRLAHMMNELGWIPAKAKWGGTDYARVIWVHPDYRVSNGRVLGPEGYDEPVDHIEEDVEII
ncbi:primase-helicase family protein [Ruegeria sp. HKCCA4812]|uniref:primase-helicase family protein n=1 Tax=Ruegeria sp. HKCCA4812 TaxID=2682993 RepID=UPI0014897DEF